MFSLVFLNYAALQVHIPFYKFGRFDKDKLYIQWILLLCLTYYRIEGATKWGLQFPAFFASRWHVGLVITKVSGEMVCITSRSWNYIVSDYEMHILGTSFLFPSLSAHRY